MIQIILLLKISNIVLLTKKKKKQSNRDSRTIFDFVTNIFNNCISIQVKNRFNSTINYRRFLTHRCVETTEFSFRAWPTVIGYAMDGRINNELFYIQFVDTYRCNARNSSAFGVP